MSLRREPFGALAYDFTTRRLSFLKSPLLVRVVEQLAESPSAEHALASAGVAANDQHRYIAALTTLAQHKMITPRPTEVGAP